LYCLQAVCKIKEQTGIEDESKGYDCQILEKQDDCQPGRNMDDCPPRRICSEYSSLLPLKRKVGFIGQLVNENVDYPGNAQANAKIEQQRGPLPFACLMSMPGLKIRISRPNPT
jgi:hypothetical protein